MDVIDDTKRKKVRGETRVEGEQQPPNRRLRDCLHWDL